MKKTIAQEAAKVDAAEKYGPGYHPDVEKAFVRGAMWVINNIFSEGDMFLFAGYVQGKQATGMTDLSEIMTEFKKDFNQ